MAGEREGVDIDSSVGYRLKVTATALRTAMESALRPLGMTVTHYAVLELLDQRPGLSGSELARGAFVTRQSMHVLLQALEQDGDVVRTAEPVAGRALPVRLAPHGRRRLRRATAVVREVEQQMLGGLTGTEQAEALRLLRTMAESLRPRS